MRGGERKSGRQIVRSTENHNEKGFVIRDDIGHSGQCIGAQRNTTWERLEAMSYTVFVDSLLESMSK